MSRLENIIYIPMTSSVTASRCYLNQSSLASAEFVALDLHLVSSDVSYLERVYFPLTCGVRCRKIAPFIFLWRFRNAGAIEIPSWIPTESADHALATVGFTHDRAYRFARLWSRDRLITWSKIPVFPKTAPYYYSRFPPCSRSRDLSRASFSLSFSCSLSNRVTSPRHAPAILSVLVRLCCNRPMRYVPANWIG